MPRKRRKPDTYYVKTVAGARVEMVLHKRGDFATKIVAKPPTDRDESDLERLERHALQAVENMLLDGIIDRGDGDYIVPSSWLLPNGQRPDQPYHVVFTAEEMVCTCQYGEILQGAPCAHLGAVYARMLLDAPTYVEIIDKVARTYGRQTPPTKPQVEAGVPLLAALSTAVPSTSYTRAEKDRRAADAMADLYGEVTK